MSAAAGIAVAREARSAKRRELRQPWAVAADAILSPDSRLGERVRRILGRDAVVCDSWPAFHAAVSTADLAVVALADLSSAADRRELARLDRLRRGAPVLLLTRLDRHNALLLAELGAALHVVWLDELELQLESSVRAMLAGAPRQQLLERIRAAPLSDWLRRALRMATTAEPPFRSVRDWARALACSVPVLEYHWRREMQPLRGGFRPKRCLDLVLVLRACELLRTQKPLVAAWRLGVHRRTLERTVQRAGFDSLDSLRRVSRHEIVERIAAALPASPHSGD